VLLTINIATLPDRNQDFVNHVKSIAPNWCDVVVAFGLGNLGDKRQKMLEKSNGKYVCIVDDDDLISEDYFDKILIGIEKDVDVICIPVERSVDGVFEKIYHYGELNPLTTQQTIAHFCPVKKHVALLSGYRSIGMGEDLDFAIGLKDHLKTAHYISEPLYYQKYISREKEYNQFCAFIDYIPRITSGDPYSV